MAITAVRFKLASIQDYIFRSNKLKLNVGASQITSTEVYADLKKQVQDIFQGESVDVGSCDIVEEANIFADSNIVCEIGDAGGGGGLIFIRDDVGELNRSTKFIKTFSTHLLKSYPSLSYYFAKIENFDHGKFTAQYQMLETKLREAKQRNIGLTQMFSPGIHEPCRYTGEPELSTLEDPDKKNISSSAYVKFKMANNFKINSSAINNITLPQQMSDISKNKEAGYIAVIHIDGNGMGAQIENPASVKILRAFTKALKESIHESFEMIYRLFEGDQTGLGEFFFKGINLEDRRLPVQSLVSGGEDITLVCDGRIGILLAEKFINSYVKLVNSKLNASGITTIKMPGACAGISIVKTKFPFYKAYQMAESLCQEAKKSARNDQNSSYLSFFYSSSSYAGSLENIRQRTHDTAHGSKYFGPYKIDGVEANSIAKLKDGIKQLPNALSMSKIHLLRDVIEQTEIAQEIFERRYLKSGEKIWKDGKTVYFDQIELMEFYPEEILNI